MTLGDRSSNVLAEARRVGVATLAAAVSGLTREPQAVPVDALPRRSGSGVVAGWARTAASPAGHNTMTWPVIVSAGPGDMVVLVCDDDSTAQWGLLASVAAHARGVAGAIVAGAARDVGGIREIGFSVFSRVVGITDAAKTAVGTLAEPVVVAEVPVRSGDLVVADDDGIVVVPAELVHQALLAAGARTDDEDAALTCLRTGDVLEFARAKLAHLPDLARSLNRLDQTRTENTVIDRWTVDRSPTALDLLDRRAEDRPDDEFLTVAGVALTPRQARDASHLLAPFLAQAGGGLVRVAMFAENCAEAVLAMFATFRASGVFVPINSAYKGEFLAHVLSDSGAQVAVCQDELADRLGEVILADPTLPLCRIVIIGADAEATAHRMRATLPVRVVVAHWSELADRAPDGGPEPVRPGAEDLAVCLYTGGTTGPSKGCLLTHNVLVHHSQIVQDAYRRTAEDVLWTPLPLFHLNAIKFGVIGALLSGGRTVISRKFSVSGFWPELAACGATIANLLGSMATLVARSENDPVAVGLRLIVAVPLPEAARQTLIDRFDVETFSGMYGMTECSTITLLESGEEHRPDSAGKVNAADYDVRIVDDAGDEAATGVSGEIIVRPKKANIMFSGYWSRPDATLESMADLWFRTGDIGKVDDDGYLWFVDRKGDYLRRRGENISSFEVETVLMKHPGVTEVAVHAVPSDLTEDDVKVTAVRSDPGLTESEFFRWMVARLPYYALPTVVEFRDELPRSPVGRVLKRQLRSEGITESSWRSDELMKEVTRR